MTSFRRKIKFNGVKVRVECDRASLGLYDFHSKTARVPIGSYRKFNIYDLLDLSRDWSVLNRN